MASKWLSFPNAVGCAFLGVAVWIAFQPGTPIRQRVDAWWLQRHQASIIAHQWRDVVSTGQAVTESAGTDTMVVFSDYRCPYCRTLYDSLPALFNLVSGLQVVYRQMPRPGDEISYEAARAALCATDQGVFRAVHHLLLTASYWEDGEHWDSVARESHVPRPAEWESCRSRGETDSRIAADLTMVKSLGLRGTPALVSRRGGVRTGFAQTAVLAKWLGH